jgi:hypothetical protein
MTVTEVAKLVFGDSRGQRVRDAVPGEWQTITTAMGVRHICRDQQADRTFAKIICRHMH